MFTIPLLYQPKENPIERPVCVYVVFKASSELVQGEPSSRSVPDVFRCYFTSRGTPDDVKRVPHS
jgi:hypothetical protein